MLVAKWYIEYGACTGCVEPPIGVSRYVGLRCLSTTKVLLVTVTGEKVGVHACQMCQVDVTDSVSAIDEAQDI